MVETQLVARGIEDPKILEAFLNVPRHRFVPPAVRDDAYCDHPLPIGCGQTISQPYMVALMTECLRLKHTDRVLEIGTGSGYQAAILSVLCKEVFTVERDYGLLETAKDAILDVGCTNVRFKHCDGTNGWPEEASFDGIIVTAGSPFVPEPLKAQLAEGGRLVIPVGDLYRQTLLVIQKINGEYHQDDMGGCVFVPLVGEHGWRRAI
jgi:protein-L-isoaspartate(D-aspartate) O-methyltransferase